ncbi:MAG: efflux RND transporter periplasmic adaptor subunit [Nevskia sp.]|nr:efflux RND transporter periplasmic adaptor subunit [Nevskia sp.]
MRKAMAIVAAVVAATVLTACTHAGSGGAGGGSGGGRKGKNAEDGPVPVTAVSVGRQDMPIYLNGLGSVLAFNTATILAQVSGQLVSVPFKEGEEVDKGSLLAQVDPRPFQATLDQTIAKKAQDQAALASAKLDLKRYQALLPDGYVTGQQVDQQLALVHQDEAQVQADDASIESARVQLSFTSIRAPFAGVAGIRQVDVGNLVSASNATGIVVLTQIKPIAVTFTLPEQALPQIRAAEAQPLTVVAVTRDNQTELARGELTAFDSQIDATTGTIKLKATFTNQDKKLWPGQFVNARLLVRTEHKVLTVPAQAVQLGPNGSYVYRIQADQTVQMQPVTVAHSEANVAMIGSGLDEGDRVVVDGQSRLQPGSKVQVSVATGADAAAPSSSSGGDAAGGDNGQQQGHHRHRQDQGGSSGGGSSGSSSSSSSSGAAGGAP